MKLFSRIVDEETDDYRFGLWLGMLRLASGTYEAHEILADDWLEGYHDALDDSDDIPDPFDPERTLVP